MLSFFLLQFCFQPFSIKINLAGSDIIEQSEEKPGMYKKLRYEHGVAEGSSELPPTSSLPLEANLQFLNGGLILNLIYTICTLIHLTSKIGLKS